MIDSLTLWTAVFTLGAYLVCGVPYGLLIAIAMGHVDVRTVGSGNIGTTNVAREVGGKAAALTLLCDVGKGVIWMNVARYAIAALALGGDVSSLDHTTLFGTALSVVFLGCILGHIFSPYLRFHGGKGIAVGFGAALGLYWPVALGLLAVFIVFVVPSRYVSLGSVAAAVSLPVWCAVFGFPAVSIAPVALAAVIVVWSHRANVARLARGEERRFSLHHADPEDAKTDTTDTDGAATGDADSKE
ncbi:glycerol-3-phosphate acyltransferase [Thermophilibacter sp.]